MISLKKSGDFSPENKSNINQPSKGEQFTLNGCDVSLKASQIIPESKVAEEKDAVAELLKEVINAPELVVRKDRKPLSAEEFEEWRETIWDNEEFVKNKQDEPLLRALQLNRLSKHRITQAGDIINLLSDRPESADWKSRYDKMAAEISGPDYSFMTEEDKERLQKKFEDLAVEIYNKL